MGITYEIELARVEYYGDCSAIIDTIWIDTYEDYNKARDVFETFRGNVKRGTSLFLYECFEGECEELDEIKGGKWEATVDVVSVLNECRRYARRYKSRTEAQDYRKAKVYRDHLCTLMEFIVTFGIATREELEEEVLQEEGIAL